MAKYCNNMADVSLAQKIRKVTKRSIRKGHQGENQLFLDDETTRARGANSPVSMA